MAMSKQTAIANACRDNNYRWPVELTSGVMFYDGYTITVKEFNDWAGNFR